MLDKWFRAQVKHPVTLREHQFAGQVCAAYHNKLVTQIAKFMGPTWGPPGSCRPQMGPMLSPWTLLSGVVAAGCALQCRLSSVSYKTNASSCHHRESNYVFIISGAETRIFPYNKVYIMVTNALDPFITRPPGDQQQWNDIDYLRWTSTCIRVDVCKLPASFQC